MAKPDKTSDKKHWSKTIEDAGVEVRLYKRPISSAIWYSIIDEDGRKVRRSLKTKDRKLAEDRARDIAKGIAEARLTGRNIGRQLTVGRLFAAYRRHRMPRLKPYRQQYAKTYMAMFSAAWGDHLLVADVDQTRVDEYVGIRRSLEVVPPAFKRDADGNLRRGGRAPTPPRDGTLASDFSWLSSVFNWARKRKVGGRRMLDDNPLHDITTPREQNVRRPVARHERFVATMEHVDTVDAAGRLRCILSLARFTGRRESAICRLNASDLLLSERRILVALAEAGMDESLVQYMPDGAIRWRDEEDKMGLLFVSPISARARSAVESYLQQNPRVGDVPLFPSSRKPDQPISRSAVTPPPSGSYGPRSLLGCPSWSGARSTRIAGYGPTNGRDSLTWTSRTLRAGRTRAR